MKRLVGLNWLDWIGKIVVECVVMDGVLSVMVGRFEHLGGFNECGRWSAMPPWRPGSL